MKKVDVVGFLFSFMKIVAMKVKWHHFFGVKKNKNLKEDGVRFKTKNGSSRNKKAIQNPS